MPWTISASRQDANQPPPIPVAEALALRNTSDVENEKILNSLGRVAAPDGSDIDYDQTWVRHVAGDLKSANPILRSSITEFEFQAMTGFNGGGLIANDRQLKYFAPAATISSWQSSKDHLMDKIVLRDDIIWSDGKPITAHDVEFSFKVIMSSRVPVPAVRQSATSSLGRGLRRSHRGDLPQGGAGHERREHRTFPIIPKHIYEKSIAEDPTMTRSDYHTKHGGPSGRRRGRTNWRHACGTRNSSSAAARTTTCTNGKQVRPKPYFKEIRIKAIEDLNTALLRT